MKVSTKKLSQTVHHPDYRWDSEYLCFEPYKNKKVKYALIGDILLSSQYGLSIAMNEDGDGTPIYRMNEITNMMCDRKILKYAPINANQLKAFKLNDRDVLFNRTNSQTLVGRTGLFRKFSDKPQVFASYLIRISPKKIVTPEYLTAFLNSKYGVLDVQRRARIAINQSNVNAEELKRVEIPLFSRNLQSQITLAFNRAFSLIQKYESKFNETEDILLSELGLKNWKPKHKLTFVKDHSDTIEAQRIDAEYYQPKYDELIKKIKSYSGGCKFLKDLVDIKKGMEVGSDKYQKEGVPFVRVSNVGLFEITAEKYISEQCYEQFKNCQPDKKDILLTKDATIGLAHYLDKEPEKMIISSGILRLKKKTNDINEECLLLVLNSILTKIQIDRDAGGSIMSHWRPDQVEKTIIPMFPNSIQKQVQKKFIESFKLRTKSQDLLECCKKAVEIAIEEGESKALVWLNKQSS